MFMDSKRKAEIVCSANVTSAQNIAAIADLDFDDMAAIALQLKQQAEQIKGGDISSIESALWSSATELDILHSHLLKMALASLSDKDLINHKFEFIELLFNQSLKIQIEKRKTLTTLASIKNPKKATFIKQQLNQLNQLIQQKNGATVDSRGEGKTAIANSDLGTLEAVNGRNHARRKTEILHE